MLPLRHHRQRVLQFRLSRRVFTQPYLMQGAARDTARKMGVQLSLDSLVFRPRATARGGQGTSERRRLPSFANHSRTYLYLGKSHVVHCLGPRKEQEG